MYSAHPHAHFPKSHNWHKWNFWCKQTCVILFYFFFQLLFTIESKTLFSLHNICILRATHCLKGCVWETTLVCCRLWQSSGYRCYSISCLPTLAFPQVLCFMVLSSWLAIKYNFQLGGGLALPKKFLILQVEYNHRFSIFWGNSLFYQNVPSVTPLQRGLLWFSL